MPETITSTCQTLDEVLTEEYAPAGDTTGKWVIQTTLSTDKRERYLLVVNTDGPGEPDGGEYDWVAIPVGADAGFSSAQKWAMFLDWDKLEEEYRDRLFRGSHDFE